MRLPMGFDTSETDLVLAQHEVNQKYRFDGVLFNDETCEIIEISYYGPLKLDKDSNEETIIWTW